jgi:LIM domain kinase 1
MLCFDTIFRCAACDTELTMSWYFEKDGLLFCKDDYFAKFGEYCQECRQIISGPIMNAGDHKFHPECFSCCLCKSFIGHGESFALIERSKLYCGQCYRKEMETLSIKLPSTQLQSVSSSSTSSPISHNGNKKPPHSIRLVEIPWPEKNKNGIKLSVDETDFQAFSPTGCRSVRISE